MSDGNVSTDPPILAACIIADAADVDAARSGASAFMESECGAGTNPADQMLPTALSASGEAPATSYLCCMPITQDFFDLMQSYITANSVPVTAQIVDSLAAFLAAQGLQQIGG
jgi:hypothetical protein